MEPEYKFWIISFTIDDAHIVEANGQDNVFRNPISTFRVYYEKLKYRYIDMEEEAKKIVRIRKSEPDPRFLLDPKNTIDDILALPEMEGRQKDREYLSRLTKQLRTMPGDLREKFIRDYEEAQQKSEEELYEIVLAELKQKQNYTPEQIGHFTKGELYFGLPQASYITGKKGFVTMNDALYALYSAWENIRSDVEKIKLMRGLEMLASDGAKRRISEVFEKLFK